MILFILNTLVFFLIMTALGVVFIGPYEYLKELIRCYLLWNHEICLYTQEEITRHSIDLKFLEYYTIAKSKSQMSSSEEKQFKKYLKQKYCNEIMQLKKLSQ